ncbi:MAG: branched-chain amino acid ABC transporter permease [Actinomycetota bacterium]|nr:branched-chain amino acid ABC transporter permease [Actinomycetota bacterium]
MWPASDMLFNGSILGEAIGFGVLSAAVVGVAAVGFTLQFGISNILNLAYAAIMTMSMFAAYVAQHAGVNIWASMAIGGAAGSALSYAINGGVYRPFGRRTTNLFSIVLVTLATGLIITNLLEGFVGETFYSYQLPLGTEHSLGAFRFSSNQLIIFIIGLCAMVAVQLLLRGTGLGRAMRATAADRELAANCGIPTERVTDVAWLLSGFLCGIAGVALAIQLGAFQPTTAGDFLVIIIAAAVLGGIGRPVGAMIGALIVSVASEAVAAEISPVYKTVVGLALLIAVLLVRPGGILSLGRVRAG